MSLYNLILLLLLGIPLITSIPQKSIPSPVPWYNVWKVRAGLPGTIILDSAERRGFLRGYIPPIVQDPKATGINSYVKRLIEGH